jgi:hypothetical protein
MSSHQFLWLALETTGLDQQASREDRYVCEAVGEQ